MVTYSYSTDGYDMGYTLTTHSGIQLRRTLLRDPNRRALVTSISNSVNGPQAFLPVVFDYKHDLLNRVTERKQPRHLRLQHLRLQLRQHRQQPHHYPQRRPPHPRRFHLHLRRRKPPHHRLRHLRSHPLQRLRPRLPPRPEMDAG